ncbi:MAG: acetylxylan esterase [Prevotellaceae bacterium]|nr:acetylxylan esterase [Prevotellaceae bacterium]
MKKIIACLIPLLGVACVPHEDLSPVVVQSFDNVWKFSAGKGTDSLWRATAYNDDAWYAVTTDKLLTEQGVSLIDGHGWYRKHVTLSDSLRKALPGKGGVMMHLGRLGAVDEVFVNGQLVGKTGEFPGNYSGNTDGERSYFVPASALRAEGDNLIAVKFFDGWWIGGFYAGARLRMVTAETGDKLKLRVVVPDSDYVFVGTKEIAFDIHLKNDNAWNVGGQLVVSVSTDDYRHISTDTFTMYAAPSFEFVLPYKHREVQPGFYRYTVQVLRNGQMLMDKKLTLGFDPEKIIAPADAKPDLRSFWDLGLAELAKVKPDYTLTEQPQYSNDSYTVYLVTMRSLGDELIRGYYAQPKKEGKHPVIVEYMGYGSKPYPPSVYYDGYARYVHSVRGQGLNEPTNRFGKWITHGLDSKETYYYRGAFLDVVRAIDFVCSRPEIDNTRIGVRGGSQGGAFSFVAAALDKRVAACVPRNPFLCDYRGYFSIAPWPRSEFEEYLRRFHPDSHDYRWTKIYDVLSYFDVKNLSPWITCPVYMGIGVQDEICPPRTNFAGYNALRSAKQWHADAEFAHSTSNWFWDAMMGWFGERLTPGK